MSDFGSRASKTDRVSLGTSRLEPGAARFCLSNAPLGFAGLEVKTFFRPRMWLNLGGRGADIRLTVEEIDREARA